MIKHALIGLIVLMFSGVAVAQNLTTWRVGDTVAIRFFCETEKDVREIIAEANEYEAIAQAKITSGDCTYIEFQYPFVLGRWVAGPFQAPSGNNGSIWTFGNGEREWFFWLRNDSGPN